MSDYNNNNNNNNNNNKDEKYSEEFINEYLLRNKEENKLFIEKLLKEYEFNYKDYGDLQDYNNLLIYVEYRLFSLSEEYESFPLTDEQCKSWFKGTYKLCHQYLYIDPIFEELAFEDNMFYLQHAEGVIFDF